MQSLPLKERSVSQQIINNKIDLFKYTFKYILEFLILSKCVYYISAKNKRVSITYLMWRKAKSNCINETKYIISTKTNKECLRQDIIYPIVRHGQKTVQNKEPFIDSIALFACNIIKIYQNLIVAKTTFAIIVLMTILLNKKKKMILQLNAILNNLLSIS